MRRAVFLILAVTATLVAAGGVALATVSRGAPDASCPGPRDFQAFLEDRTAAQTFTATRSGRLTSAEVLINEQTDIGSGDILLKIARVDASGAPTNDVLATATITDAELNDNVAMRAANFKFNTAANVVAGKQYALIARKSDGTHFNWFGRNNTSCPGDMYFRDSGEKAWEKESSLDFVYNVYVAPNNDDFAFAKNVKGARTSVAGTTLGASREAGEPDHYTPVPGDFDWIGEHSVWYRWTAPASGRTTIDTCEADIDSILAVYAGDDLRTLKRVADNNNACPSGYGSEVTFRAREGVTYRIAVGDAGGATQDAFTLDIRGARP